jgi:topoisomerase IA-like protein
VSEYIEVPFAGEARDRAVLLLAAAEDLDLDQQAVVQTRTGAFYVPQEVAEKAGLYESDEPAPAKKAAAKKAPAKKSTAKKSAAKKSTAKPQE